MNIPQEIYAYIVSYVRTLRRSFPTPSECDTLDEYDVFREKIITELIKKGRVFRTVDVKIGSEEERKIVLWHETIVEEARDNGWFACVDACIRSPPKPKPTIDVTHAVGGLIVTGGVGMRSFPIKNNYRESMLRIVPKI
jgi:hypothetical protein